MVRKISFFLYCFYLLSSLLLINGCLNKSAEIKSVKFIAIIKNPSDDQKVYLTGSNEKLGRWKPDFILMDEQSDSVWIKTISFNKGETIDYKITAGTWWTEALDSAQSLYKNLQLEISKDTVIKIIVYNWKNDFINGKVVLNSKRFQPGRDFFVADDFWKYRSGDNLQWAEQNFDDSNWPTVKSNLKWNDTSGLKWNNIGWFRFHFIADSSIWNRTLAISIGQFGASQIFYNGKLLYSFGEIGTSSSTFKPLQNGSWKEIKIDPEYDQLIAVRYANYNLKYQKNLGFNPGFAIILKDLNTVFLKITNDVRASSVHQMIFTMIPLILFLLHLTLYAFYRKQKQNLFYAFCLLGFAGLTYFNFEKSVITDPGEIIIFTMLNTVSAVVTIFFGTLTGFTIACEKLSKYWRFLLAFGIATIVVGLLQPTGKINGILIYIFFALSLIGIFIFRRKEKSSKQKGTWIISCGFIILIIFIIYQLLIDFSFIIPLYNIQQVFVYGMLGLAISMSLFLAINFAHVNKDLEIQLNNVKILSEKSLEQERLAGKLELERRIMEVESQRQTKELDDARDLQLSLLPENVPKLENLDIACFMKTAAEVGGDYYDFFVSGNKTLSAVIGDATGHGLKAGNMVIVTKGLLNILSGSEDLDVILQSSNRAIKKMNLYMLTMCLAILRIDNHKLQYSSAGMPPLLIYRKQANQVEQFVLKAMPLGAFYDFPYKKIETTLSKGDVILLMSDGLTELFNREKEIYETGRVIESLKEAAEKAADEIANSLYEKSRIWSDDAPLSDDLTIVVIKILE